MMRSQSLCGMMALCLCLSMTMASAAEKEKGKNKKGGQTPQALTLPKTIELSAEQKTQVASVRKEFMEGAKKQQEIVDSILTPELKKARAEAMKEAREAGKKGKELKAAADEALSSLSAEDKTKFDAATQEINSIRQKFFAAVKPILTEEQAELLPQQKGKGSATKKKKKEQV